MPIYTYAATGSARCAHCADGFDCLERLSAEPLSCCPECGAPVARRLSAPNMAVGGQHLLRESHLAKHGFTQYRRVGKGVYEKTVGKGPDHISGD